MNIRLRSKDEVEMRKNYGYDSYRGRSPLRSVLKWIIALLTAVLVLTVAALLWLQQFMVYSSEGEG